ncbi:MAG TPA: M14 family zinc carboxypeptidase [Gemmatimonadaceae bacterium]|nr:M14 family zinc carboxypeptidase [Gemmatimonadaceae bacterium]
MSHSIRIRPALCAIAAAAAVTIPTIARAQQAIDSAYTAQIKQDLQDPRISTELVDYLPASATVPTPLKVLGHIIGAPGILDRTADIYRYFDALDAASPRVKVWRIGKTEEGRDMILAAVADEQTIEQLDTYRDMLAALGDPRKTTPEHAQQLMHTAKPIYYMTSGIHSPEFGGPEMLMELAYRLAVDSSQFITNIRNNVIVLITPVIEPDGRDKAVDTYYFNKKLPKGATRLPLMYWGKYVQHDNNRDGMGQFLKLTQNTTKAVLQWHPTILHDLHEAQTYLYASTGTGPYNESIDPITIDEWWMLAENDVMEMTKRGVPGVWTYGFYDGWTPNYLFFIAHTHNEMGRFYEVQSYGPDNYVVKPRPTTTSREWFRPNPPLDSINWGPRNNTNIQESAILFALSHVAKNKELYLDNFWRKNVRAVDKGKTGPVFGWVIPARQRRKANAADAVNDLRAQGLEVHVATKAFTAGNVSVEPGDYIIRGDQPYRTLADMYFSLQHFSPKNPSPYDDTGWTFPLMRDVTITAVNDRSLLEQPMTPLDTNAVAPGGITGTGSVLVVDNAADNNVAAFRFRFAKVKMQAAEEDFDAAGHHFRAGAIIIPSADRGVLEPALTQLGLSAYAMDAAPSVKTHALDVPRIGYVHSWTRTQDEGWVRAALDNYGIPYTYFGGNTLRQGKLRQKYDVIVLPHISGSVQSMVNGIAKDGPTPLPYRKTSEFQSLGTPDASDDIRGGIGLDGIQALYEFVQQGGTLIVEGGTSTIFPSYNLTPGVTIEEPDSLFARGSVMRGVIADMTSPIVYGYGRDELPVYFNQGPVMRVQGAGGGFGGFGRRGSSVGQDVTPMATPMPLSPWNPDGARAGGDSARRRGAGARGARAAAESASAERGGAGARGGAGGASAQTTVSRGGARGGAAAESDTASDGPRLIMRFPQRPADMLLSGTLLGGEALSNRAQVVDERVGKGHIVMFAIRPFWRWQTQGTYMLGFNAIMNWNDLDAGRSTGAVAQTGAVGGGR